MGWRRALRSATAAKRRAEQERNRAVRELNRSLTKIDHEADWVQKKALSLEKALQKDFIKALGLRFDEESGFSSEPLQVKTGVFSGEIRLISTGNEEKAQFEPSEAVVGEIRLRPLDLLITQWAVVVALRIEFSSSGNRLPLKWIKKTDPRSSKVILLDPHNHEYYSPLSTNLIGEVLPGHPRVGLIAFEPFRKPTSSFTLNFSDINVSVGGNVTQSFTFSCKSPSLSESIESHLAKDSLSSQIRRKLDSEILRLTHSINKPQPSGCFVTVLLVFLGVVVSVILTI